MTIRQRPPSKVAQAISKLKQEKETSFFHLVGLFFVNLTKVEKPDMTKQQVVARLVEKKKILNKKLSFFSFLSLSLFLLPYLYFPSFSSLLYMRKFIHFILQDCNFGRNLGARRRRQQQLATFRVTVVPAAAPSVFWGKGLFSSLRVKRVFWGLVYIRVEEEEEEGKLLLRNEQRRSS